VNRQPARLHPLQPAQDGGNLLVQQAPAGGGQRFHQRPGQIGRVEGVAVIALVDNQALGQGFIQAVQSQFGVAVQSLGPDPEFKLIPDHSGHRQR